MPLPEGGFRRIGERERLVGPVIRLVTGTFVGPDGYTFEREIVRHLGAVCVVPLDADGDTVHCVRQYRAALDTSVLELPAGKLDVPGEEVEAAARRELAEEVGFEAGRIFELGRFYNSPGFTDELTHCFLAEDLLAVPHAREGIEERHMIIEPISLTRRFELIGAGVLVDAKTIIGLSLAAEAVRMRRQGPVEEG